MSSSDVSSSKGPTPEEKEAVKNAQACIDECHIEQLVHDTKFLRVDSLLELVKALIFASSQAIDQESASAVGHIATHGGGGGGSGGAGAGANSHHPISNSTSLTNLSLISATESRIDYDAAVFSLECLIKVN